MCTPRKRFRRTCHVFNVIDADLSRSRRGIAKKGHLWTETSYSQVDFKGIPVKRRKIIHLKEDGGCGHEWYTVEIADDFLGR